MIFRECLISLPQIDTVMACVELASSHPMMRVGDVISGNFRPAAAPEKTKSGGVTPTASRVARRDVGHATGSKTSFLVDIPMLSLTAFWWADFSNVEPKDPLYGQSLSPPAWVARGAVSKNKLAADMARHLIPLATFNLIDARVGGKAVQGGATELQVSPLAQTLG